MLFIAGCCSPAVPTTLEVEVFNHAGNVPVAETRQALKRVLASSSLELVWSMQDPNLERGRLIVLSGSPSGQQQADAAICPGTRIITLRIAPHAPPDGDTAVLGFALPFAASGVNATVYFDRVRLASTRSGVPLALLLAHAIAHEMGHVLLKTNRHTRNNLMAETWSRTEFQLMEQGALAFDESEKARILERLERKGCGCGAPVKPVHH